MKIGIIGLGRMGMGVANRLIKHSFEVLGYDKNQNACNDLQKVGGVSVSMQELVRQSEIIWLMVPEKFVDSVLDEIVKLKFNGMAIIDGGNSYYKDSQRRYKFLKDFGIEFLDCGTSGGLHGEKIGYCLMLGGLEEVYHSVKNSNFFDAVAAKDGYGYMGLAGAGHYVKMIHNGIEYALLQSYAEGFQLLKEGEYKDLDLKEISEVWMHGSIIRSFILDLAHEVFKKDQDLKKISGKIGGGQTGIWTSELAKEYNIPDPMIQESLKIREDSQKNGGNYSTKLVALLRNQFGGHPYEVLD